MQEKDWISQKENPALAPGDLGNGLGRWRDEHKPVKYWKTD